MTQRRKHDPMPAPPPADARSSLMDPEITDGPKVHVLKTVPEKFRQIGEGLKTFEWRFDDRNYAAGDTLVLMEFEPCPRCNGKGKEDWSFQPGSCCQAPHGTYSGREWRRAVTLVMRDAFGMPPGYVVMAIVPISSETGDTDA